MMVDILHQLLKGTVMYLVAWTVKLIKEVHPPVRKRKRDGPVKSEDLLDKRFREVPCFPGLKHFKRYTRVVQWTGVEQKAMVHQLIAVIAPLLIQEKPAAVLFARAAMDFVMMAFYRSHDDNTLQYMTCALERMDKLKGVFHSIRTDFNYPKWHSVTHFVQMIKDFGTADGTDTGQFESGGHKVLVKQFYGRTNKQDSYLSQIAEHNTSYTKFTAMDDHILHKVGKPISQADKDDALQLTAASKSPIDLRKLGWLMTPVERGTFLGVRGVNPHLWRQAKRIETDLSATEGFLNALAVFIRNQRATVDGTKVTEEERERSEKSSVWCASYLVALHGSITCWARDGKDPNDTEKLQKQLVRCSPIWQRKREWRRDYVWVQRDPEDGEACKHVEILKELRPGQLLMTITVIDPERWDEDGINRRYTGAWIHKFRLLDQGTPHAIHGMIEVERIPSSGAKNPRKIGPRRFYELSAISRNVHLVPAGKRDIFYINNYVDWDQYNSVYHEKWEKRDKKTVKDIIEKYGIPQYINIKD